VKLPLVSLLLLLAFLIACDGVGRGLVDQLGSQPGEGSTCAEATACESKLPAMLSPEQPGDFSMFESCVDRGDTSLVTDKLPLPACVCGRVDLTVRPDLPSPTQLLGDFASLRDCGLRISSNQPVTLELNDARLENVRLELIGPIALHVDRAEIQRTRIDSKANQAGTPSLRLENSQVVQLSLVEDEDVQSQLLVSHSTLAGSFVRGHAVRLESVALVLTTLIAHELDANDLSVSESLLELDRGLLAAAMLSGVRVAACGRVRIVGSELLRVEVAACRELLQLYNVSARMCWFDGPIEADDTDVTNSSLGLAGATSLLSYNSRFSDVTLCDQVSEMRTSQGSVTCVSCSGPLFDNAAGICSEDATFTTNPEENPCPAFAHVEPCASFPPRTRPH
jgi:hypothetical protein